MAAVLIVAASIGYNLVEAVVSIAAGAAASSVALIGFGLDSLRGGGGGRVAVQLSVLGSVDR